MKKMIKFFGVLALSAIIIFSLMACDGTVNGPDPGPTSGETQKILKINNVNAIDAIYYIGLYPSGTPYSSISADIDAYINTANDYFKSDSPIVAFSLSHPAAGYSLSGNTATYPLYTKEQTPYSGSGSFYVWLFVVNSSSQMYAYKSKQIVNFTSVTTTVNAGDFKFDSSDDGSSDTGSSGGTAGKRIARWLHSPIVNNETDTARTEFNYDASGRVIRLDVYNNNSQRIVYHEYTAHNPDGQIKSSVTHNLLTSPEITINAEYEFDAQSKVIHGYQYMPSVTAPFGLPANTCTSYYDYYYDTGGRPKYFDLYSINYVALPGVSYYLSAKADYEFNSSGRRIKATMTMYVPPGQPNAGSALTVTESVPVYNTDGTTQKVVETRTFGADLGLTNTRTYEYENGPCLLPNWDDFSF